MSKLRLSLCCGIYDRTRALFDETVQAEGIDLVAIPCTNFDELFRRTLTYGDYDISELSFSNYLYAVQLGLPWIALPVFLSRKFRHAYMIFNTDSGIHSPSDLVGKRVGCAPSYYVTAAIWQRGTLQHEYGVKPEDVSWFTDHAERLKFKVPAGVSITVLEGERCGDLLEQGRLDAMIGPLTPTVLGRSARIKHLFDDPRRAEIDYFKRTGIYPIMHTLVVRDSIVKENPWICKSIVDAFRKAKDQWKRYTSSEFGGLAWSREYIKEEEELLGPDPYPYNVEDNVRTLQPLIQYCAEQGVMQEVIPLERLFPESVLNY